jgi:uncharacterized protein (UPF0261 family)
VKAGVVFATTLDTKSEEAAFLCDELKSRGVDVILIDCGVLGDPQLQPDISASEVARAAGVDLTDLRAKRDRAASVPIMMHGLALHVTSLMARGLVQGFVAIGGGTNAALATAAFAALPLGVPKLLVSTVVSGNTRALVGFKDVVLFHSVVDVLGVGTYLRRVLRRAAGMMEALVRESARVAERGLGPSIAMTTYGSTTAAANHAIPLLREHFYEVLTFHAMGVGGRAAEAFIADGQVQGSFDLTTTEIADELIGGVCTAGPERLDAAGVKGIPQVVLPGAIDMVNFGVRSSIPERFANRHFLEHTPFATLMRTTPDENKEIAQFIGRKLNAASAPTAVVLPLQGFSAYDAAGAAFFDPAADEAFRNTLKDTLKKEVEWIEVDAHINDPQCMQVAVATFNRLMQCAN